MAKDFLDINYDPADSAVISPPTIQWLHGSGDPNHPPVIAQGGFELPVARFGDIPGLKRYPVKHEGQAKDAYLLPRLGLAVVAIGRKQWFTSNERGQRVFLPAGFEKQPGQHVSSRTRLYAICRELAMPVLVTFTGTASRDFFPVLTAFKRRVIQRATQMKARQAGRAVPAYPLYVFWLEIEAGPYKTFEQGGYATPPTLATTDFSDKALKQLFVGQEVLDLVSAHRDAAKLWREGEDRLAKTGSLAGPEEPPSGWGEDDEPAEGDSPLSEDEIPF